MIKARVRKEIIERCQASADLPYFMNFAGIEGTLTDPTLSCPGPLLKTTPPPPGYPWVSGVQYVTPEPRNRGLVLDHQL